MSARTRFIASIVTTAKNEHCKMPWHRGAALQKALARRRNDRDAAKELKRA